MITLTGSDKPWLAHYDKGVPPAPDYRRLTLPQMFQTAVGRYPRHTALIYQGRQICFAELQFLVRTFAITLTTLGIQKGDVVGIWLPNTVAAVVAYYATLTMGAIVVMNGPLSTDEEMAHQMNDANAKLLITLDTLAERAIALRAVTRIETVVHASLGDYLPLPLKGFFPLIAKRQGLTAKVPRQNGVYSWKEAMTLRGTPIPEPAIHPEEVAVYQYTKGKTGPPTGVMLTHANLTSMAQMYEAWFQLEKGEERVLAAPPFFQVPGMATALNLPIHMGWSAVLVPRIRPKKIRGAIKKYKPTLAPLDPTLHRGPFKKKELHKTNRNACKPIPESAIPQTHLNPLYGIKKSGSMGLPLPGTDVRIMDLETGTRELAAGEAGEMWLKGPQVPCGYLGRPQETLAAFQDGWFKSGDVAWMDEDGYFYIVGRKQDFIKTDLGAMAS